MNPTIIRPPRLDSPSVPRMNSLRLHLRLRALARALALALGFTLALGLGSTGVSTLQAQVPEGVTPKAPTGFELNRWAREPMLRSPVALSHDDRGRLYVVETARRGTVDIDIRSHASWVVDDLANQSVDDLRNFFRSRMSTENSLLNAAWLRDYNQDGLHDWHDLEAVKEKVHWLEDSASLGKADRAKVFAEGFNEEINGVIAGVLPWEDDVFVTIYPDLWRLRDTDGDGVADRKEIVFRGFGVHAAFDGHDLHGLIAGPDGKIYFSVGDNGFSVTNREGRRLHHPNTGGVLRMNPDGSDLEVFATGLRNPQEIAFDDWGNLFAVDNDGDLADERERFVFITEGSDSGWRLHWQFRESGWAVQTRMPNYNPWVDERMWVPRFPGQPAHITPPLSNYSIGPGSFRYNPGTALTDAYRGYFFLIQFPVAKVTAFQIRPRGAGFEMVNEHTFVSGMMASSLDFSPDGALCLGDWDGMWSPSGRGSVWRVDHPEAAKSAVRIAVRDLLREGFGKRSVEELTRLLGHADQRIRLRCQFELVRRREFPALLAIARSNDQPALARAHALWGLGQGGTLRSANELPLADPDPRIRAQAAKVAGTARLRDATPRLIQALKDDDAAVRLQASLALGKISDPSAFDGLVGLLAANADQDGFLRHGAVVGLAGSATPETISALSRHPSSAVRLGAVVALRRLRSPAVQVFLADTDASVSREAARAIHDDDSIPAALPALAARVDKPEWNNEPGMLRRVLSAHYLMGTEAGAQRLAAFAEDPARPEDLRLEAVECLAGWSRTPALDRVQGFVRPLSPRAAALGNETLQSRFNALTRTAGPVLLPALVRVALENHLAVDDAIFAEWAVSEQQSAEVRARSLEMLASRKAAAFTEALPKALASTQPELRLTALRLQAEHRPEAFLSEAIGKGADWPVPERQAAFRLAATLPGTSVSPWLGELLDQLTTRKLQPEISLDVVEAVRRRADPALQPRLAAYEKTVSPLDPLARYRVTLRGGDPKRGQEIFRTHANAQCIRCHEAGGEGQQVGPVLKGIASRVPPEYLLESLVLPSARIADGYATTSVELSNGDEVDGVRLSETGGELTLRMANGVVRRIPRRTILRQTTSSVSAMPPMGEVLTSFELRDLMAYLISLKEPAGASTR